MPVIFALTVRYTVSPNIEHMIRKISLYYREETRARYKIRVI